MYTSVCLPSMIRNNYEQCLIKYIFLYKCIHNLSNIAIYNLKTKILCCPHTHTHRDTRLVQTLLIRMLGSSIGKMCVFKIERPTRKKHTRHTVSRFFYCTSTSRAFQIKVVTFHIIENSSRKWSLVHIHGFVRHNLSKHVCN